MYDANVERATFPMMNTMTNTSTLMTMKTAYKALQRTLQLLFALLAITALLIALLAQPLIARALTEPFSSSAVIRLAHEEPPIHEEPPTREGPSRIRAAALRVREAASRLSHTRPDNSRWHAVFFELEIALQRRGESPANDQGMLDGVLYSLNHY